MAADRLEDGIRALNAGNRARGRRILADIIKTKGRSEAFWMRLALELEDPRLKQDCFQQVLKINPNNVKANKELIRLQGFFIPALIRANGSEPKRPNGSHPPESGRANGSYLTH